MAGQARKVVQEALQDSKKRLEIGLLSAGLWLLGVLFCTLDVEDDHLCEKCQKLDLRPRATGREVQELNFGTVKGLFDRYYCPLCRLVAETYCRSNYNDTGESVILRWNAEHAFYFTNDGDRIVFVDQGSEIPLPPQLTGRVIGENLDTDLVRTWLRICEENHSQDCVSEQNVISTPASTTKLTTFRLIDVQAECLIDAMPGCRYVALSYIWGKQPIVKLQTKNKVELYMPGSFRKIRKQLSQTIADSIDLVSGIGERYLWLDCLCLLQDDEGDKVHVIQSMDLIYQGAILTIVAAAGPTAMAGLPGVHPKTRKVNQLTTEVKPGVKMIAVSALYTEMNETPYMARGGT